MQQVLTKWILGVITLIAVYGAQPAIAQNISSFSALAEQNRSSFKPLSQEQAFPYIVSETSENRLQVTWQPAAEHYLYKRAFKFTLHQSEDGAGVPIPFSLPQGLKKTDEFFGAVEVYYNQLDVSLKLPQAPSNTAFIVIEYQGCADWGFCYPPQSVAYSL